MQVTGQFSLVGVQASINRRFLLRLLAQDGLADDAFDIGIGKLHLDREARLQPLQGGCRAVQRGLPGADQQQSAAKISAHMLGDFLHIVRALNLFSDELLDFVDDQQRARKLAVRPEDLLDHVERIVNRRGIVVLELSPDGRLGVGGVAVFGLGNDQRLGQWHGKLEAADFLAKLAFLFFEDGRDLAFVPRVA